MSIEINVPVLPESVADATIAKWYKSTGDTVVQGESLVDLETDKVMLEVPAPADGTLGEIIEQAGACVVAGQKLAMLEPGDVAGKKTASQSNQPESTEKVSAPAESQSAAPASVQEYDLSPAVRRLVAEHNVEVSCVSGTGKSGRITKQDVEKFIRENKTSVAEVGLSAGPASGRGDRRVPMSRLRARVAERLCQAQRDAAMLTTFNEVNMEPVMSLRSRYRDEFEKAHGVRLGFMSFFVKASTAALQSFPEINASVEGTDIIYHEYFDVGIAVSSPRGLVVPILRDADQMDHAEIEKQIIAYANKAKDGKLTVEEITGGTFSITNGGIFGSMLSTPILNLPQSAILGMHNIVKRPVVENDEVVIRPVMYLALTYDHRIVDGAQSVRFLVTIKEMLEDPSRLLLDI